MTSFSAAHASVAHVSSTHAGATHSTTTQHTAAHPSEVHPSSTTVQKSTGTPPKIPSIQLPGHVTTSATAVANSPSSASLAASDANYLVAYLFVISAVFFLTIPLMSMYYIRRIRRR